MVLYSFNVSTQIVQLPVFRQIGKINHPYKRNFGKPKLKLYKTISVQLFELFMSHIGHVQDLEAFKLMLSFMGQGQLGILGKLGKLAIFAWSIHIISDDCLNETKK